MNQNSLQIGWSQTSITPNRPLIMEGQMYQRASRYVHDPLTATALALDNGETQAIFVSLDMTMPPVHAIEPLKQALKAWPEIKFENITFNVTHTHNSSSFYDDFMRTEFERVFDQSILPKTDFPDNLLCGEEALSFFVSRVSDLIVRAWNSRKPGGISYAHDYAAVGFNRRPQFALENGLESIMYGDCSRDDYVRFEGGTDTAVELLYTWDETGDITGVVCNVPCPSQVYELHCFLTADYWAPTRTAIREKLQKNVYVLSMCGAAGDLAPVDLVHISKTNRQALKDWGGQTKEVFRDFDMTLLCQSIADRISEAVIRGYRTARNYIDYAPIFAHEILSMHLPIRQVSKEDYLEAEAQAAQIKQKFSAEHPMTMVDVLQAFEPLGVIVRYRQQVENPDYNFECHILRLGNVAFATNPFELFQEYGQRMKARAEAEQVFIVQLSNGIGGYLPTQAAVNGGSYSSKPASTICGPEGGDELVEKTLEVFRKLWH